MKNDFFASNIFLAVLGLVVLLVGVVVGVQNLQFIRGAVPAQGTIVDYKVNAGKKEATRYTPLIRFDAGARSFEILSNVSYGKKEYQIGEKVQVYYDPDNPENARLKNYALWTVPAAFLGFGALMSALGIWYIARRLKIRKYQAHLAQAGQKIMARFQSVSEGNIRKNKRQSFHILADWQDTATGKLHVFKSDYVWFDPEPYIPASREIPVLVDPQNPKIYLMDTSFLPEEA